MATGVKGSLEQPPIVLQVQRHKMVVAIAGSIAFVALGLWILQRPEVSMKGLIGGVASVLVFGIFALIGVFKLFRPDRMELSPAGLRYIGYTGKATDLPWTEISGFRLWRYRSTTTVVFDVAERARAQVRGRQLNRFVAGADVGLPSGWPLGAQDLMKLLSEAKARWG